MNLETKDSLTPEEREIVALGASVGSGCRPCVNHHVHAGRDAGLSSEQIVAIVLRAHGVAAVAADRIAREGVSLARTADDGPATQRAAQLASELAALGAAIAANSMPDIEEHLAGAAGEGVSRDQLAQAVSVAQEVQRSAASIHARKTAHLLDLAAADDSRAGDAPGGVAWAAAQGGASDGGADDCGCSEKPASTPKPSAREQATAGTACDPSRMAAWVSEGWDTMMDMMGADPTLFSNCCVAPASHEAAGGASDSAEAACAPDPRSTGTAPWTRDAMRTARQERTAK